MRQINDYVNSLFKNQVNSSEVKELKNEIKLHLFEAVNDLKQEGYSEEESIKIAITRFGGDEFFQGELSKIIKSQGIFAKNLLGTALTFLIVAIFMFFGAQAFIHYNAHEKASMQTALLKVLGKGDKITPEQQNEITSIVKKYNSGDNYVAIFHTAKPNDGWDWNLPLAKANYLYPQKPNVNKYFPETLVGNDKHPSNWMIEIQPKSNFVVNDIIWGLIPFIFVAVYWALFSVWAIIDAYRRKRLTVVWTIAFCVLNVIAYIMFRSGAKTRVEV